MVESKRLQLLYTRIIPFRKYVTTPQVSAKGVVTSVVDGSAAAAAGVAVFDKL